MLQLLQGWMQGWGTLRHSLCIGGGREARERRVSEDTLTSVMSCILWKRICLPMNRPEPVYRGRNLVFLRFLDLICIWEIKIKARLQRTFLEETGAVSGRGCLTWATFTKHCLVHVAVKTCPVGAVPSEESGVGMLNDTALAVPLHKPQGLHWNFTVLDVQHLQVKAVGGHDLQALAGDALTGLEA